MALDQDGGVDGGQADGAPPDLGPGLPTVTVVPLAGSGTADLVPFWAVAGKPGDEAASLFTLGSLEVHQPSGPDLVDLPGSHAVVGLRAAGTSPYTWTVYSDEMDVQLLEGGDDFVWLYFATAEPRGLNGTTTMGPKLVRVMYDGTSDMEIPVPAEIGLSSVGEDPSGEPWLLGAGMGPIVIDGTSLGAMDQEIRFLARRTPTGLVDPILLATDGVVIDPYASARLLDDGDLLVAARTFGVGGTLAGEAIAPEATILARIDLAGPTLEQEWTVTRRTPELFATEAGIELQAEFSSGELTIGDHTYTAIDGAWTTHVRVSWDPLTEAMIPEGEVWPVYPEEVDTDGLHVGQYPSFGLAEIFTVLAADHSVVRRVKTDGRIADRTVRWDGGVFTGVLLNDGGAGEVVVEGGATEALAEVAAGNQSFWVLQLDTETGAVLRRKGYDAGPAGPDSARVHAFPLTPELFVVAIRRSDETGTTLMVDGWNLPEPVVLPVLTTGEAECDVSPWGQSLPVPRREVFEHGALVLTAGCDGAHGLSVDGQSFEFTTNASTSAFRFDVE